MWCHDLLAVKYDLPETRSSTSIAEGDRCAGSGDAVARSATRIDALEEMIESIDRNVHPGLTLHEMLSRLRRRGGGASLMSGSPDETGCAQESPAETERCRFASRDTGSSSYRFPPSRQSGRGGDRRGRSGSRRGHTSPRRCGPAPVQSAEGHPRVIRAATDDEVRRLEGSREEDDATLRICRERVEASSASRCE